MRDMMVELLRSLLLVLGPYFRSSIRPRTSPSSCLPGYDVRLPAKSREILARQIAVNGFVDALSWLQPVGNF